MFPFPFRTRDAATLSRHWPRTVWATHQHASHCTDRGQRRLLHLLGLYPAPRDATRPARAPVWVPWTGAAAPAANKWTADAASLSPTAPIKGRAADALDALDALEAAERLYQMVGRYNRMNRWQRLAHLPALVAPCRTLSLAHLAAIAARRICLLPVSYPNLGKHALRVARGWLLLHLIGRLPQAVKRGWAAAAEGRSSARRVLQNQSNAVRAHDKSRAQTSSASPV